jgi:DNA-binding beta-propeller fold protein YncE
MVKVRWIACVVVGLFALMSGWVGSARAADTEYHVLKKIKISGAGGWDYLTCDPEARRLYISRATRVQVMDVDKGEIIGEIANTPGVHGIALAPKSGKGFTSNGQDGTSTIFDLKTLKELDRVKVGSRPDGIIYDPASERIFTFNAGSKDATAIDAESGKVAGSVPLGGKPESAVSDEKGQIYANLEDKDEVVAFDAKDLSVKGRWSVAPGKRPVGLSMDRKHRRLFVSCGNEKMVVLDAESGKPIADLPIGKGTDFCVFDAGTNLAFSSNGDGTLTIVHEEPAGEYKVLANVKTEPGARTMALDTKTHNIFLVTAKFKPAPQGKRRGAMEPDSFVVLEVGK